MSYEHLVLPRQHCRRLFYAGAHTLLILKAKISFHVTYHIKSHLQIRKSARWMTICGISITKTDLLR
jgi:hypothetical protein